jgi:hypothetical protein
VWLPLARLHADNDDRTRARAAAQSAVQHLSAMVDDAHADLQAARRLACRSRGLGQQSDLALTAHSIHQTARRSACNRRDTSEDSVRRYQGCP